MAPTIIRGYANASMFTVLYGTMPIIALAHGSHAEVKLWTEVLRFMYWHFKPAAMSIDGETATVSPPAYSVDATAVEADKKGQEDMRAAASLARSLTISQVITLSNISEESGERRSCFYTESAYLFHILATLIDLCAADRIRITEVANELDIELINTDIASLTDRGQQEVMSSLLRNVKKDKKSDVGEKRVGLFVKGLEYMRRHNLDKTLSNLIRDVNTEALITKGIISKETSGRIFKATLFPTKNADVEDFLKERQRDYFLRDNFSGHPQDERIGAMMQAQGILCNIYACQRAYFYTWFDTEEAKTLRLTCVFRGRKRGNATPADSDPTATTAATTADPTVAPVK